MTTRFLLAALLLASPLAAQRWTPPPGWTPPALPTAVPTPAQIVMPADPGLVSLYAVREADARCGTTRTATFPRPESVRCFRVEAMRYLVGEVQAGRLVPGPAYAGAPLYYSGWTYGLTKQWVQGMNAGVPWEGCAHGIAYTNNVFITLGTPFDTLSTLAWETANEVLAAQLDRYDLTDGAIVAAATNAARAACPAD